MEIEANEPSEFEDAVETVEREQVAWKGECEVESEAKVDIVDQFAAESDGVKPEEHELEVKGSRRRSRSWNWSQLS